MDNYCYELREISENITRMSFKEYSRRVDAVAEKYGISVIKVLIDLFTVAGYKDFSNNI